MKKLFASISFAGASRFARRVPMVLARLVACLLACWALGGCSAGENVVGAVGEGSPHLVDAAIEAGSDFTESGQYVEVCLEFDAPVAAVGSASSTTGAVDVTGDFSIELNGEAPDAQTIVASAVVEDGVVIVRLVPTAVADGRSASVYFALYEGQLTLAAAADDGSLPHIVASDDDAVCAVLDQPVRYAVPSGVVFELVESEPGSSSEDVCAHSTYRIVQSAQLRCISWLGLSLDGVPDNEYGTPAYSATALEDGTLALKHNHFFYRDTPEGCAADIADVAGSAWSGQVDVQSSNDTVTVTARQAVDGQTVELRLFEGRLSDA